MREMEKRQFSVGSFSRPIGFWRRPDGWDCLSAEPGAGCFSAGGGRYAAPGQTAKKLLDETRPALPNLLEPTYTLGVRPYPLKMLFPSQINRMLENGLRRFERRIPGFSGADAFLTGVETRTSSPIRILREEDFQSPALKGLYPCGEGPAMPVELSAQR